MINPTATYRISPYCVLHLHADNETFTLVHGLYGSRFELSSRLLPVLAAIANGATLGAALDSEPPECAEAMETLIAEKVLLDREDGDRLDFDPFKNRLSALELAVHRGVNEGGYFPSEVDHAHPPALRKRLNALAYIELGSDPGLASVRSVAECLGERRSIRAYANDAMPKEAFEQFLSLTARAYALVETRDLGSVSSRNYPSGGARYPLEVYPLVYNVAGVEPGLYHYDPFAHRLGRLEMDPAHRARLREAALEKMGGPDVVHGRPAVLFLITAVYARTCWKYRGMPYQLILMETGALYQTMYLVATMLGLAPCPVGAFPELAVAELLGLDSRDEGQVGLFALGVPDPTSARAAFSITAVRRLESSPFAAGKVGRAIELTFSNGEREIVDLAQVHTRIGENGLIQCGVLRGRQWAPVAPEAEKFLRKFLPEPVARAPTDVR